MFHKDSPVCGGTDRYVDKEAPKTIRSERMTMFSAASRLPSWQNDMRQNGRQKNDLEYVSAFAAPAGEGTFVFLETCYVPPRRVEPERVCEWIQVDIMPLLTRLVQEQNLAKDNGYHSRTHGLPEDFGGSINIDYESGEKISVSNNQSPVLSAETGEKIVSLFRRAIADAGKVQTPDPQTLVSVSFFEEDKRLGEYSRAVLTKRDDGTCLLTRESKYDDDPEPFTSEKSVDASCMEKYRSLLENCRMLAWPYLPQNAFKAKMGRKTLTFAFAGGASVTVPYDRELPQQVNDAFFKVELDLTTVL